MSAQTKNPGIQSVAVLFGGRSSEHEISLRSAVYVLKNIPAYLRIIPVGISKSGEFFSPEGHFYSKDFAHINEIDLSEICEGKTPVALGKTVTVTSVLLPLPRAVIEPCVTSGARVLNAEVDLVFPVLHGANGEDGRLQGLLEMAEIPYVGCDLRASAIGIDKNIQKIMAAHSGIDVARYVMIEDEEWFNDANSCLESVAKKIGFPCFVKPNALGSAVGVNRAQNAAELRTYIGAALRFDEKVLVEEPMSGTEVECAFLGTGVNPKISVAGEIVPKDFYSYEAKYINADGAELRLPAKLSAEAMALLQQKCRILAKVFGLGGLCRIDFWNCARTGRFVFNEVNTLPGLTSISMFPKLWELESVGAQQWIVEVIDHAAKRHQKRASLQFDLASC